MFAPRYFAPRYFAPRYFPGAAGAALTQEAPVARTYFWKAQDRAIAREPQDRTLEWTEQKRSLVWIAQNRTFVWLVEVINVTAKWVSSKDPGDITNWTFDYSAEMSALGDDTIATSSWVLDSSLTEVAESNTDTTATVKISGGVAGTRVECTNTITTTTSGETFERTVLLTIEEVAV